VQGGVAGLQDVRDQWTIKEIIPENAHHEASNGQPE